MIIRIHFNTLILLTFGVLTTVNIARAQPPDPVIVLVVDKLAAEDFIDFSDATAPLYDLSRRGAVGLLNVRTGGGANSANGYLSLSTGQRAVAGSKAAEALSPTEQVQGRTARDVYSGFTGKAPTGEALHVGIGQLGSISGSSGQNIGVIGGLLSEAGITTALVGNGDLPGQRIRHGALLAMNDDGTLEHAIIGNETILLDPMWPTGVRTDYETVFQGLWDVLGTASWVVVDLADLARLEEVAPFLDSTHALRVREQALADISSFVQRVILTLDEEKRRATVYLVAPSPPQTFGRQGILMTPIFRWGPDNKTGFLTSPTTRRIGIVTNFDFLPSIMGEFDLDLPSPVTGRPWTVHESSSAFAQLLDRYVAIREVHLQRLPVIQPYFFIVLGILATGLFLTIAVQSRVVEWTNARDLIWKAILCTIAAYPAALLILSALPTSTLSDTSIRLLTILIGIGIGTGLLLRWVGWNGVPVIGLVTTAVILLDIATGATLMQGSLLGYDPVSGSRFYGIGNEYMGVLMGSSLMATAFILERQTESKVKLLWPSLFFLILAGVMAHPRLGINVGGAITAACAAVVTYIFARDQKITWQKGLGWGVTLGSLLIAIALADMNFSKGAASHLGRAAVLVSDAGVDPLWDIFSRKIAVNLRLIRLTIWSRVALGSLGLLSVFFLWPNWIGRKLKTHYPWLVRMSQASLVSALVTLVVNDSGVVAAATLLLWPALALLSVSVDLARQHPRVDVQTID